MPFSWFRSKKVPARKAASAWKPRPLPLHLEQLEDRLTPSPMTFTVDRPGDAGLGDDGTSANDQPGGDIRYVITQTNFTINLGSTITFDTTKTGSTITL